MAIRWGFLGAGFVASRGVGPAVHEADAATLYAVASRDAARSATLEPERVHSSYDALLADERVDAVYISLANSQHLEWVIKSLEAGKHVLCEKPLGCTAEDVAAMFDVATAQNRLLVEAVWARWHPRYRRMVDLVQRGAIGDLSSIESSFTFTSEMTGNFRLDPAMGGGALLDVGGYQVHTWVALTEGAPNVVIERVERLVGPTGVDLTTEVHARVDSVDVHAVSSFAQPSRQELVIGGTDGVLRTGDGESFTTWNEASSLIVNDEVERFASTNAFVHMIENVSHVLEGRDGWVVPAADSLRVATLIDELARHP